MSLEVVTTCKEAFPCILDQWATHFESRADLKQENGLRTATRSLGLASRYARFHIPVASETTWT